MEPALRLDRVSRTFGGLQAVDGVELTVRPGERRALIGPNGAGKTTLFNLISGALPVTAGRIALFGRDVTAAPAHRRAALGLARTFQITNLFPDLSVLENCLLAVQAHSPVRFSMLRPVGGYPDLGVGAAGGRGRWCATSPTASSGSSRSRWPWPGSRGCCCWTSPPPASRRRNRA
jgi:branched-chain amino acid transport system ATP-binding protein